MSHSHAPRLNYFAAAPDAYGLLAKLSQTLHAAGLDPLLISLVELRASQINGCAFCIDMHAKEAKIKGERELRLYALSAWRESPLFSDAERAALAWTETLTRLPPEGVPDELFQSLRAHFDDAQIALLSLLIATINAWNRVAIGFRSVPGSADKLYGLDKAGLR